MNRRRSPVPAPKLAPTPEEASRQAVARALAQLELARNDPNEFVRYIGVVQGGARPKQGDIHREWQDIWTRHPRSVLLGPVFHGKTVQLRWRLLWEMGRNPNIRIAYLSATERHPKKQLAAIKQEIENNSRLRLVFPNLRPASGSRRLWTATEMLIDRPSMGAVEADPTWQCFGLFGKLLGSRTDLLVVEDLCNFENTLTERGREKMGEWMGEAISRLTHHARMWAVGNLRHEQDELQRLRRKKGYYFKRFGAYCEDEHGQHVCDEHDRPLPLIPEMGWNEELIEAAIEELGPVDAEMLMFNRSPPHKLGRFKQAWFDMCLQRGAGLEFVDRWSGSPTYTGVDLGHRKAPGSDLTTLFTATILPEGTRRVLDIRSGLWSAPEILREIQDVYRRYGSIIAVENNAAQNYLLEFASELDTLPIRPHATTLTNKHDRAHGIESLGIELQQSGWMLPCDHDLVPCDEMGKAIKECLAYDPTRHPGDRLMAWWIMREAMRLSPAAHGIEIYSADLLHR